ncbi:MAG: tRNA pseudouridine(38-40) synthase TruA [Candidatus Binatus sp.]|uniref:tRNA pseudouridine(38-40) synthase TruA n=1 Tax=Candidatus Binatus sp. TaxID=2811406 RepID=UPI003CBADEA0
MVLKLTIEYDGRNYSGWQLQPRHDSIQGRIEAALERIFAAPVRVFGSGRTDAGVHARGQVASISIPRPFDATELQRALNSILPADIVVLDIAAAPDDFDPRRAARSRVYEYRVLNRQVASAFDYRYSWLVRDRLDLAAMNRAAQIFVGDHDFAAFRSLGTEVRTTIRRVISSEWTRAGDVLVYRVEANSFLRHMVRAMVAAMIDVGRGKLTRDQIATILAGCDRGAAPANAPPGGLYLVEVRY